jgi:hypothetical protein
MSRLHWPNGVAFPDAILPGIRLFPVVSARRRAKLLFTLGLPRFPTAYASCHTKCARRPNICSGAHHPPHPLSSSPILACVARYVCCLCVQLWGLLETAYPGPDLRAVRSCVVRANVITVITLGCHHPRGAQSELDELLSPMDESSRRHKAWPTGHQSSSRHLPPPPKHGVLLPGQ